ncbi:MAG TPA: fructosamine kinase family protein [Propionibacteriaceae bacterium]|nr:fructosamine kinase family protein [Propionibacteriaceae bacterium]
MPERFVKRTPPRAALYEAAGLRWLAEVVDGAPVVEVLDAGEREIVLERLIPAAPTREAARKFGEGLAVTHDAGAPAFGVPPSGWQGEGWIGTEPMTLHPSATWGAFYAEQRCLPYARRAYDRGGLDREGLAVVERACTRISGGLYDDDAPPARIHGDLWAGNVVVTARGYVLIDPAAHGGHRITDLAMLALFGAPFLEDVYEAYESTSVRLPDDWRALVGLHQLHPLLVHAALFGGGYGPQATAIARGLL